MAHKLIILADCGGLKAYKLSRNEMQGSEHLELVDDFDVEDSHGRLGDKVSDQAGSFPAAGGSDFVGTPTGENHNLRTEMQKRAIRTLAGSINDLVRKEQPLIWFFASPKEINQKITAQLDTDVRGTLKKNLRADLIKADTSELLTRFA